MRGLSANSDVDNNYALSVCIVNNKFCFCILEYSHFQTFTLLNFGRQQIVEIMTYFGVLYTRCPHVIYIRAPSQKTLDSIFDFINVCIFNIAIIVSIRK